MGGDKKRIGIKIMFVGGVLSVIGGAVGLFLLSIFGQIRIGVFDAFAQGSKEIPEVADSLDKKRDSAIRKDIECIPEIKEKVAQTEMRSKLQFQMQLIGMTLDERDRAIERVLKLDTTIKRAEIYKEIYGSNYR